jgi:hypothetical protein
MEKQLAVYITGSGTKKEIIDALKKIVNSVEVQSKKNLADGFQCEGPTLMTEIEEYEPR